MCRDTRIFQYPLIFFRLFFLILRRPFSLSYQIKQDKIIIHNSFFNLEKIEKKLKFVCRLVHISAIL